MDLPVLAPWQLAGFTRKPAGRPRGPGWKKTDVKRCTGCGQTKKVSEFYWVRGDGNDRPMPKCKECTKRARKEGVLRRGDEINARRKVRYRKNPQKFIQRTSRWYQQNKKRKADYDRRRREAGRDPLKVKLREERKAARIKKQEQVLARRLFFKNLTPEQRRERKRLLARENQKRRLKTEPAFKMLTACRNRITYALLALKKRKRVAFKSASTQQLLGCDASQLVQHLESQFDAGMSWENHGGPFGWEVDHIKPCAKFDLTLPEQQRACFHYTNLQPLWKKDNLAKRSKYE